MHRLNKKFVKYLTAVFPRLSSSKDYVPMKIFTRRKIKETVASPRRLLQQFQ
jgi:hypothetical protein